MTVTLRVLGLVPSQGQGTKSLLGALRDWPQPLRLAVSLCVKSQFPIIIHWGWPDLNVLYNDAFIPLIGDKHPTALGTRLFDSWPELRPTIEGILETVLTKGPGFPDSSTIGLNETV